VRSILFNIKPKGDLIALELYGRGLLLVRAVGWIVVGFDFREAPHAGSVDLGDGVLERLALGIFLDRPVLDLPLQADELPLLERLGEVGEIAPATCGGANLVCCYVTAKSFFQLSLVATFEHEFQFRTC